MHDTEKPRAKPGAICPLLRKDVSKVCHTCMWWVGLQWDDPKTEEVHHKWNCAQVMAALTNVDVVKATAGTRAATESFRNEMVIRSGIAPMGHVVIAPPSAPMINGSAEPKLIGQD